MAIEKLTYDDAFALEVIVDKINEIIDRVEEMEDDYDRRISAHWKFHRKEQEDKEGMRTKKTKGKQANWKKEAPTEAVPEEKGEGK